MDYAQTLRLVRCAANLGTFNGIIVDMLHHEKAENFENAQELA
jgi:hypothetical protein